MSSWKIQLDVCLKEEKSFYCIPLFRAVTCGLWVWSYTSCCVDILRFTPNTTAGPSPKTCARKSWQPASTSQRRSGVRYLRWPKTSSASECPESLQILKWNIIDIQKSWRLLFFMSLIIISSWNIKKSYLVVGKSSILRKKNMICSCHFLRRCARTNEM